MADVSKVNVNSTNYDIKDSNAMHKGADRVTAGQSIIAPIGTASTADGFAVNASGDYSHASGFHTIASSDVQHVIGKYNEEDANGTYPFIIGGGRLDTDRKNIFTVDWNGVARDGTANRLMPYKAVSEAEYAALSQAEKTNGTAYFRYEATGIMRQIQDDGSATSLTSGALPTGQTITSYLNSNFVQHGIKEYIGLGQGGYNNRISVTVNLPNAMPNTDYYAVAEMNKAYADFPYINFYIFDKTTTSFTVVIIDMNSGSGTNLGGVFKWLVIGF